MFKKLALVIAALAVSAPALADHGYRYNRGYGHGHGHRHVVRHYHVQHRPVVVHRPVVHHYYRPAPRPVYVVQQHHSHVNPVAVLAGAVIGAAIVHHVVTGY